MGVCGSDDAAGTAAGQELPAVALSFSRLGRRREPRRGEERTWTGRGCGAKEWVGKGWRGEARCGVASAARKQLGAAARGRMRACVSSCWERGGARCGKEGDAFEANGRSPRGVGRACAGLWPLRASERSRKHGWNGTCMNEGRRTASDADVGRPRAGRQSAVPAGSRIHSCSCRLGRSAEVLARWEPLLVGKCRPGHGCPSGQCEANTLYRGEH